VIPADEDPRRHHSNTEGPLEEPPLLDAENFPALGYEFLKLPAEIRELIWEAFMYEDETLDGHSRVHIRNCINCGCHPHSPHFIHDIVKVSKETRNEIIAVQMRNSRFMIASERDNNFFRRFIASAHDGPKHVRELYFDNFDYFPDYDRTTGMRIPMSSDMELAVNCTGLRTLQLTVRLQSLGTNGTNGIWTEKTVQELVEKYRLARLLDCRNLRKVVFDGRHGYLGSAKVLDDLADWVKAEFAKKNHSIQCEVRWRP
jgi:hypothetical protein